MKKEYLEFVFITVFLILIFSMKIMEFPKHEKGLTYYQSTDFNHYKELMKWFIGQENNETVITYQYPPLYPILLIPITFIDTVTYLLFLNFQLLFLIAIPLFLLSRQFLETVSSGFISGLIILFFVPIEGFSLLPILLASFIFAWFIYFFINFDKDKYFFWGSSLSFALLIMTKYIFFYLLPFIILWIFLLNKQINEKIKAFIIWIVPTTILFFIWSIRNMLIHGFSLRGMIGGYSGVVSPDETPLNVFFNFEKITSVLEYPIAQKIFLIYIFVTTILLLIIIFYKKGISNVSKYYGSKKIIFIILLLLNFFVFLIFPGMTWEKTDFNIKYLKYFIPTYLVFSFSFLLIVLFENKNKCKYLPIYIKKYLLKIKKS